MTTPNNPDVNDNLNSAEDPLIPPVILLGITVVSLFVALFVYFTQPSFGGLGFGALAFALISLVAWAALNPQALRDVFTGRGLQYGGTAILVTGLLIVASVLVYSIVSSLELRQDFSNTDIYTLNEQTAELIEQITADPTLPDIEIVTFFPASQGVQRDQADILLDDIIAAGDGRITTRNIDPNRNPELTAQYGDGSITAGQLAIVPVASETGEANPAAAEVVPFLDQFQIVNGMITALASGDFNAYLLPLSESVDINNSNASLVIQELRDRFKWDVEQIGVGDLISDDGFGDEAADGEVLVIVGGVAPLADEVREAVIDYMDSGGDVVIFGEASPEGTPTVATNTAFGDYLWSNFGVRMRNDIAIDSASTDGNLSFVNTYGNHPITANLTAETAAVIGDHSIEVSPSSPANVTVTPLLLTSEQAFSWSDVDLVALQSGQAQLGVDNADFEGQLTLAVAAEDSETGTRLVMFGGVDMLVSQYLRVPQIANAVLARRALFWASNYEDFTGSLVNIANESALAQDAPVVLEPGDVNIMGFVSLLVMPFGLLGAGFFVLSLRRS